MSKQTEYGVQAEPEGGKAALRRMAEVRRLGLGRLRRSVGARNRTGESTRSVPNR
jgi:hypothetical protein